MAKQLESRPYTAWQLLKAYWQSDQWLSAYLYFFGIVIMTISIVGMSVVFNYWINAFYDALQAYDKINVILLLKVFFFLAAIYIILAVYRFYIAQFFGLRWRKWLTQQFLSRWLAHKGYYYLENFDETTDNPDQRIQEDILGLVNSTIDLFMGLLSAIVTFCAFIYVLWQLSGILQIPLGPLGTLNIPGYLVWVAIAYAALGTYLTFKIGRPLVSLNFEQQRREATFRFAAVDLRSHAEHVALYRAEDHQRTVLNQIFSGVLENWYFIILRQKLLLWFTAGYNQISVALPLLVVLPNYFKKVFMLGGLIQSIQAFSHIQEALSFIVNSYTGIATWQATLGRLLTFLNHLYEVEQRAHDGNKVVFSEEPKSLIAAQNLSITTPQGKELLRKLNQEFILGQHYLIKGSSGIGKSTLIRTIAGIWPFADGKIVLPENQSIMYLPQKSYMPLGTLEEAILFPDKHSTADKGELLRIMEACRLKQFIPLLHEVATWSDRLSPGEQQRVALARVLVHKPNWIFLDESTSALDLDNEIQFYQTLKQWLPGSSIISVGHRPSLDSYHDHVINLEQFQVVETALI